MCAKCAENVFYITDPDSAHLQGKMQSDSSHRSPPRPFSPTHFWKSCSTPIELSGTVLEMSPDITHVT